ncbi:hypothetical protein D8B46_00660, partial [Candidatus Gracilibacteria bacterium]
QKLMLSLDVPPILKKYRSEIKDKEYLQHGKVFYVNKESTSSACPSCNDTLTIEVNGILKEKDSNKNKVYQLFGHISQYENEMHHINDKSDQNYEKKWESGILEDGSICDYNMKHNPKGFDFIRSGDDLATYNIAKKAKEYLEFLEKQKNNNS